MSETERSFDTGLNFFQTAVPGIGGILRTVPSDFQVTEQMRLAPFVFERTGRYGMYRLTAIGWETFAIIRHCARVFGIHPNKLRVAGMKDKHAITIQHLQIESDKLLNYQTEGLQIEHLGRTDRPMRRGSHDRNMFEITVRESSLDRVTISERIEQTMSELQRQGGRLNLYGIQRFGGDQQNHLAGYALATGDHRGALQIFREQHPQLSGRSTIPEPIAELYVNSFYAAIGNHLMRELVERRMLPLKPVEGAFYGQIDSAGNLIPSTVYQVTMKNLERTTLLASHGQLVPVLNLNPFSGNFHSPEILRSNPVFDVRTETSGEVRIRTPFRREPIYRSVYQSLHAFSHQETETQTILRFGLGTGSYATVLLDELIK